MKFKVINYEQTCSACPSQWDIFIHNNEIDNQEEYIYARYRWGILSVTLYNEDYPWNSGGKELISKEVGDGLAGSMTTEELVKHTKHVLDWSDFFDYIYWDDDEEENENDAWWNSLSDNMKTLIRKEYE